MPIILWFVTLAASVVTEYAAVRSVTAIARKRPVAAANWSVVVTTLRMAAILIVFEHYMAFIALVIGDWIGTWLAGDRETPNAQQAGRQRDCPENGITISQRPGPDIGKEGVPGEPRSLDNP